MRNKTTMSEWSNLELGSKIEYDIRVASEGKPLLVKKGTVVTPQLIKALSHFETTGEQLIVEKTSSRKVGEITMSLNQDGKTLKLSEKLRQDAVDAAQMIFRNDTPLTTMQSVVSDIAAEITDSVIDVENNVALCIQDLRTSDEYTYQHSVDVSILAASLGKILGMKRDTIYDLAQAGLLHDIGKRRISPDIINKADKLTPEEFEIVKLHPQFAFSDLRNCSGLSDRIKVAVYEHHEKANGKGYPRGLVQSQISDMGQILSIVDVYDALTSKRSYKDAISSANTIGIMSRMMNGFNIKYLGAFIGNIILYPIDTNVICTDGDVWKVVSYNEGNVLRPILYNENTGVLADLTKPEFSELSIFGEDCEEIRAKYISGYFKNK